MPKQQVFLAIIIILSSSLSFGLGRLSKIAENRVPLVLEGLSGEVLGVSTTSVNATSPALPNTFVGGKYVASKSGKKYHFPWCAGAKQIRDANKMWFNTTQEAEDAGYSKAANCPGL